MKELILLVGPIGVGKSTYSLNYAHTHFRISQDDLGKAGHMEWFQKYLDRGENIIVDRMNFSAKQRARYIVPAKEKGYRIRVVELYNPDNEQILRRVTSRKNHPTIGEDDWVVARAVLTFFHLNYQPVDLVKEGVDTYVRVNTCDDQT